MTTWHTTPDGHDVYTVTLAHGELHLVYEVIGRELGAIARELATERGQPWRRDVLALRHHHLTILRDSFDPAKVRGDQLRAGTGPTPPPEAE